MTTTLNWRRGILVGALLILGPILLGVLAVLLLSGTDWGRERVRRVAQNQIAGMVHGHVTIGRLSGNLLVGMTVHNFAITDSAGAPFASVESFKAHYSIVSLLEKRVWIDGAVVVRPLIVLDRRDGGSWNWQRIFPRDTTPKPTAQQNGWADQIRFTNVQVENGQLVIRSPWHPPADASPAVRDSLIRVALGGGSRLMINRVGNGFQKTVQLDSVTATIPLLRLSEPGVKNRLLEVSSLRMNAFPFRAPGAVVRDLKGVFPFNNDSAWWKGAYVAMPNSKASGDGSYVFGTGDLTMQIHTEPASFADMRWVYPRLPADGTGKLDLALTWRGAIQNYTMTNADITMGAAHGAGSFGITMGDTITIHDTNLRFSGIDTRTLEQLIPHFSSPRRGTFAGHAIVSGGRHALAVNGDVRFDDQRAGRSRVIVVGGIGLIDHGGLQARNLHVQMLPVQVAMARTWDATLPIGGVVTGTATINGSTNSQLAIVLNVDHRDRGTRSVVDGKATIRLAGAKWFDADVTARPVSLEEVGRFFPTVGLQGSAAGPIHITGAPSDLRVQADLRLPDGGRFTTRGTVDVASREKAYELTSRVYTLNLRTIDSKAPITSLTALAYVHGRGTQVATMRDSIVADLSASRWDSVAVDTVSIRATLSDGLATITRLYAHGASTNATVSGTFGLTRADTGHLVYRVATDSLGAFNRWIPRTAGSTAPIAPRPQVIARAVRRARDDSTRIARATEMERLINGRPGPVLKVNAPKPVPADTVSGTLSAAGTMSGNLYDFTLRGRAGGDSVIVRGNYAKTFKSEYAWTNARTPTSKLVVGLNADSVSAMGFAFDTVSAQLTYASSGGHVNVAVIQDNNRQYGATGDYAFYPDRKELKLADMKFRFDTAFWSMPHPGLIQWGGPGIQVTDFELRNRGTGRIYANGLLPTEGVADFRFDVDNFPLSNVVDIVQTDIALGGIVTLHGTMTGTLSAPAFRGAFGVVDGTYNATPVPVLLGRFGYADNELVTHIDARRQPGPGAIDADGLGTVMTTVDGRIPINLAFTGVTGSRLLPKEMSVDIVADSLPLELIPQFTGLVSNVHGQAAGKFAMRGTLSRPSLVGAFTLARGTVTLATTGATIESIGATIRMANDTVFVDSIAGWAQGPVRVRGTLAVGNWREPSFALYLVSNGAELMNNQWAKIRVDAGLALTGPFNQGYLSGAATITQGVVYAPEPTGRHLIGAGDPALFNVLDTTNVTDAALFPAPSPLVANLRMDIALSALHNTWVRNREANIEIYTDDPINVHEEEQAFELTGVVTTDRGEYNFLSKKFQIKRGSAMFIGSPDLNPTLQITGEYSLNVGGRDLDVRVLIGGTVRKPKLSLESDAQPPRTQSELLSLLAFGPSSSSNLAFNSSSIVGTAATSDLFGVGAQVAAKRLGGVALGVAVDQLEVQAGRAFGTDVFDITPGDIPSGSVIGNLLTQTKLEAGKYINPRTFVSAQEQALRLGLGIEHRTADGWKFSLSTEPRILLREPTLIAQPWQTRQAFGGFILRDWRF